jgi:carbonic anhydrase
MAGERSSEHTSGETLEQGADLSRDRTMINVSYRRGKMEKKGEERRRKEGEDVNVKEKISEMSRTSRESVSKVERKEGRLYGTWYDIALHRERWRQCKVRSTVP